MAYTNDPEEGFRVLISQKKWDKAKRLLRSLRMKLEESLWVDHNEFEKGRGGLIYVSQTYPPMTLFLKGRLVNGAGVTGRKQVNRRGERKVGDQGGSPRGPSREDQSCAPAEG
jgi:hypothetical protein